MATTLELPNVQVLPEVAAFVRRPQLMLIDGEFREGRGARTFATYDPATGGQLADVAEATESDIDDAVSAARRALDGPWSRMTPADRERQLLKLADLVERDAEFLAELDSLDSGKPVSAARAGDVPLSIACLRYFAGWATKIAGDVLSPDVPDAFVYTRKQPVGVVGAIIPWNFPIMQATWKLGPALAAGCTVILKPAEQTPLSALRLAELTVEAGLPPGVVNVCPGFGETAGAALVEHPGVDKITFTGSLEVAKRIVRGSADSLKHVSLELGGKSPNIVLADADLGQAASAAADAIFANTGQVCSAGSRLLVERQAFDEVVDAVVEKAQVLKMGPGMSPETTLGPLVSDEQLARVRGYVQQGIGEGAQVAAGGSELRSDRGLSAGYFVEPTVLLDVDDRMTVAREEIFGPVLVAQPFDSLDEVARRANDTNYGLSAAVWTRDIAKAHRMAHALDSGTVWINCYNYYDVGVPWGGFKQSGYGRDCGREGLEKYLQTKAVWTSLQ